MGGEDLAQRLAQAQAALDARRRPRDILEALASLERENLPPDQRARFFFLRGIALNRFGEPGKAQNDLIEARNLFEAQGDRTGMADVSRELGVVHAWRGAGRDAGFAFVRALAEAASVASRGLTARAAVEAARACLEIGRAHEAIVLLDLVLQAPADLPVGECGRAQVMLAKALNDDGQYDAAAQRLQALDRAALRPRETFLSQIESIRNHMLRGEVPAAMPMLDALEAALPADDTSYEHAEFFSLLGEAQLAAGDGAAALGTVEKLIPRVERDDLGAPLVAALGQKARALDLLGRGEEAAEAAAGALRRAAERQLQREADALRESLVLRGDTARALLGLAKGRIDGRFVRSALVGEGGFGKVIRAFDRETGDEVALKQIRTSKIPDRDVRQRMFESAEREVEAARSIAHAGVARVIGLFYETDGDVFVASTFVHGRTLRRALNEGRLPLDWMAMVAALADALAAVHERDVVHSDVKPENVILSGSDGAQPVLVDFGSATFSTARRRFGAATFTPAYAAPEQKRTFFRRVGPAADVFALGGIAYELMCGARLPPIEAYELDPGWGRQAKIERALRARGAAAEAADLIARCLAPWPGSRPDAAGVSKTLNALSAAAPRPQ